MDGQLLVVAVNGLLLAYCVRACFLTDDAGAEFLADFVRVVAVVGSFDVTALAAEEHCRIFREDSCSLRDNALEFHKSIQVHLTQLSQLVLNWEVVDSDEDRAVRV